MWQAHPLTTGHNWHIHTTALSPRAPICAYTADDTEEPTAEWKCSEAAPSTECARAGGHYDPMQTEHPPPVEVECPPSVLELGGRCPPPPPPPPYTCAAEDEELMRTTCYAGDLSAKLAPVRIGVSRPRSADYWPAGVGRDPTLTMAEIVGKSVVIHAADGEAERIGCGDIIPTGSAPLCRPLPAPAGSDGAQLCHPLTHDDYWASFVSSCGELPGILLFLWLIDRLGRRPLLSYMVGFCAATFVLLLPCLGPGVEMVLFFISRGCSNGFFQGVYLYTSEIYPADVRATAMGVSSSCARIGLISTPIVAQWLDQVNLTMAMLIYFFVAAGAVVVLRRMPIETTGRPMLSSMQELVNTLSQVEITSHGEQLLRSTFKDAPDAGCWRPFRWTAVLDGQPVAPSVPAQPTPTHSTTNPVASGLRFAQGSMVRVVGLVNTPQHNGKAGRIMGFVQASKRYQVLIRESTGPDTRLALLERNLSPDHGGGSVGGLGTFDPDFNPEKVRACKLPQSPFAWGA